jgi:hypothetical protein
MRAWILLVPLVFACGPMELDPLHEAPTPAGRAAIDGLHLTPSSGDWWRFTLTEGASGERKISSYRFVLGVEHHQAGRSAFELRVEGGPYAARAWRYLSFEERGIFGSDDGTTFVPLFDAWDGAWISAGGLWRTAAEGPVHAEEELRDGRPYQVVRGGPAVEIFAAPWGPFAHRLTTCADDTCTDHVSVLSETSYR